MSKKDKARYAKLIVNPGAGKADEGPRNLERAARILKGHGIDVDVVLAHPKEEAVPIAKKAVKDGYDLVIAMGGDGTLEAVISGMVGSKTRLGILPVGTANNVARSLGIPLDLEEACTLIAEGNTNKLDLGQAKMKDGRKQVFFEMTAVGLVAAVYPYANKVTNGRLSELKDAAMTFLHQDTRPKVKLTLDDESKIELETMLVVVSNTPIFGKNFLVAPNASLQDGLLDVSVYPEFSKAELLAYFARVMNENNADDPKIQRYRARTVKIKADPKQDVIADGIVLGRGTVEVKSRPSALWVISPQAASVPALGENPVADELPAPVSPVSEVNYKPADTQGEPAREEA